MTVFHCDKCTTPCHVDLSGGDQPVECMYWNPDKKSKTKWQNPSTRPDRDTKINHCTACDRDCYFTSSVDHKDPYQCIFSTTEKKITCKRVSEIAFRGRYELVS